MTGLEEQDMMLRLKQADETLREIRLTAQALSIGRSREADVVVADEKISRLHCGIRFQDGEYHVRDLKSRNGTYLNDVQIEDALLQPGDRIRLGSTVIEVFKERPKGEETMLQEVEDEMAGGKGYTTMLRDIVEEADPWTRKKKRD